MGSDGVGSINLRSETPPEDSIQIFPSEFGSYSVRALREIGFTHARVRAHVERKLLM